MHLGLLQARMKTKGQAHLAEPSLHFTLTYLFSGNLSTVAYKSQRRTLALSGSAFHEEDPLGQR